MALNIPMPSNDRSGLFKGLLYGDQTRHSRNQLEQQKLEHQDSHAIQMQQQARLAELQPYVIEQYKQQAAKHPYIIAQYEQAQQLAPLERQYKMSQINNLISEQAQREFDQEFVQKFMNGQNGPQGMPGQPDMQQPMPQPNGGPPGMVVGAPRTPSMGNVPPPSMEQLQNGFGGQAMHPILAAKMKKLTGWDPNELSPEQKRMTEIKQFREKEEIKKQMKGEADLASPTKATVTSNQSVITASNNIIPQIEHLKKMEIPYAGTGAITSPDKYAKYEAQSNAIADGLMAAFGWPKTDQALQMAKQMVKRKPLESEGSYKARLNEIIGELKHRRASAHELLSSSKVKPNSHGEMLMGRINGQEVKIHPSKREIFIEQGGELL